MDPATLQTIKDTIDRAESGKPRFQGHDNTPYDNATNLLPSREPRYYTEWAVAESGERRGGRRLIFGGDLANPDVIYYSPDHYTTFVKVKVYP